jgi:hypothetical protein
MIPQRNFAEMLKHLVATVSNPRFLKNSQGLNDLPFYICPYEIKDSLEMQKMHKHLLTHLAELGIGILDINLYDLSVELLQARGIWERVLEMEPEVSKDEFKELLQGVLDTEQHLVPAIAEKMQSADFQVLFISGVGEVFPFIRSHNVLNNLQTTAKEKPTLLFFPGSYVFSPEKGASLDLFGRLHDDKYYRAKNIFEMEA